MVRDKLKLEGEAKVVEVIEVLEALFMGSMVIEMVRVDKEDIFATARATLQKGWEAIKRC